MDRFQKIVAASYVGGEFNDDEVLGNMDDCGDGLFKFLMVEISEDEDCDNYLDAILRLDTIIRQVTEVKKAMKDALEKKKIVRDDTKSLCLKVYRDYRANLINYEEFKRRLKVIDDEIETKQTSLKLKKKEVAK